MFWRNLSETRFVFESNWIVIRMALLKGHVTIPQFEWCFHQRLSILKSCTVRSRLMTWENSVEFPYYNTDTEQFHGSWLSGHWKAIRVTKSNHNPSTSNFRLCDTFHQDLVETVWWQSLCIALENRKKGTYGRGGKRLSIYSYLFAPSDELYWWIFVGRPY